MDADWKPLPPPPPKTIEELQQDEIKNQEQIITLLKKILAQLETANHFLDRIDTNTLAI